MYTIILLAAEEPDYEEVDTTPPPSLVNEPVRVVRGIHMEINPAYTTTLPRPIEDGHGIMTFNAAYGSRNRNLHQ